jgi:hypothetical protein
MPSNCIPHPTPKTHTTNCYLCQLNQHEKAFIVHHEQPSHSKQLLHPRLGGIAHRSTALEKTSLSIIRNRRPYSGRNRGNKYKKYEAKESPNSSIPVPAPNNRKQTSYLRLLPHNTSCHDAIDYLTNKYNWTDRHFHNIQWRAHEKALAFFTGRRQRTIMQFIHGWLPGYAAHSKMSCGTARLCPYCTSCDETQQHWLQCQHIELNTLWKVASDNAIRKIGTYIRKIDVKLLCLLTLAITKWRTTKSPPRPDFLTPNLYALFDTQSQIGWDQIILGRFSKKWIFSTEQDNVTNTAYIIRTIWYQAHEVWLNRCSRSHGIDSYSKSKMALLRLTPQVEQIYKEQPNLMSTDQYIFKQTIEETLNLPTTHLNNWIFKAKKKISKSKEQKKRTKKNHLPPHPFFIINSKKTAAQEKKPKSLQT